MPASSEPPSRRFPNPESLRSQPPSPADRSALPLGNLLPALLIPLEHFPRIDLDSTRAAMRAAVMHSPPGYLLVFASAEEDFPLGYVHRTPLAIELLTGNRADVQRLVTLTPCLPISISLGEALRLLGRKQAELGILCDLKGAALGCCTRECLQQLAPVSAAQPSSC